MAYRCAAHEHPVPGCTICDLSRPPGRITRNELAVVCERHTVPAEALAPVIALLHDLGIDVEAARTCTQHGTISGPVGFLRANAASIAQARCINCGGPVDEVLTTAGPRVEFIAFTAPGDGVQFFSPSRLDPDEITAKALFAVHNDQVINGQLQFVERSYVLPTTVVAHVHELVADYEMPGTARAILVSQR